MATRTSEQAEWWAQTAHEIHRDMRAAEFAEACAGFRRWLRTPEYRAEYTRQHPPRG
jgi:hypothetical protein